MRTHACGLSLSVFVYLLVLAHPVPAQQIPPGYDLRTDHRVSGAVLVNSRPGSGGATLLMRQSLGEVRPFFGQMRLLGAFADKKYDQRLELLFAATAGHSTVQGLGIATTEPGRGTVVYAFDSPQTITQTLPVLLALAGHGGGQDPTRGLNWQVQYFPDGSGQMELPDGWQFTFANKGMVSAKGPQGQIERGVRSLVYTRAAAAQMPRIGGMGYQGLVCDPTDPVTALQALTAYSNAFAQARGISPSNLLRVVEVVSTPPVPGYAQAAFVDYEYETGGARHRAIQYILLGNTNMDGTWVLYTTYVASRSDAFAQNLPVLVRIWGSARTSQHVIHERIEDAMRNFREAGEIWQRATQNRERSLERSHANWTEAMRGTRTILDTRTGDRADVDLGYASDIVRKLNEGEPGRYREVPLRELVR